MEETSTENAKISDSGYSNTCSNSQSHTSGETLPKPITKHKDKAYKKNKSKSAAVHVESILQCSTVRNVKPVAPLTTAFTGIGTVEACKPATDYKTEEKAVVELVDATDPGVHNDNDMAVGPEAGLDTKTNPIEDSSLQFTEDVYAVIFMHDGVVLYVAPTLLDALGYPKDSWTGKLFIDFLDPRDKPIFTSKIISEIAVSRDLCSAGTNDHKASFYCRLRRCSTHQYASNNDKNGQQSGFYEEYVPYRTDLVIQNYRKNRLSPDQNQVMILVASFHPVQSAYKDINLGNSLTKAYWIESVKGLSFLYKRKPLTKFRQNR